MDNKNSILNYFNRIKILPTEAKKGKGSISIVAHRGASGYAPENTMAAFEKAFQMKADYLELDIQMTKYQKLVVLHDPTFVRTKIGYGG